MTYVYVASSWRNEYQPEFLHLLRSNEIPHYDFRNPPSGSYGFSWRDVDPEYPSDNVKTSCTRYLKMVSHPIAKEGFEDDKKGMEAADTFVLIMPAGNSAHLELGWAIGKGLRTAILLDYNMVPELMYLLADFMTDDPLDILKWIRSA